MSDFTKRERESATNMRKSWDQMWWKRRRRNKIETVFRETVNFNFDSENFSAFLSLPQVFLLSFLIFLYRCSILSSLISQHLFIIASSHVTDEKETSQLYLVPLSYYSWEKLFWRKRGREKEKDEIETGMTTTKFHSLCISWERERERETSSKKFFGTKTVQESVRLEVISLFTRNCLWGWERKR